MGPTAYRKTLITLCLLVSGSAFAGGIPYTSAQYAEAYRPLVAGQPVVPASTDDGAETVPIGFPFFYQGQNFESVSLGVNGAANLASSCGSCSFDEVCTAGTCTRTRIPFNPSAVASSSEVPYALALWWDDLHLRTGSTPEATITYGVRGAAPNREFVAQWSNLHHISGTTGSFSSVNFQLRLFEGSGVVLFHYGPMQAGQDTASFSGYVGIEIEADSSAVVPSSLGCAGGGNLCDWADLVALEDTVIQFGPLVTAELVGAVIPGTGGVPGGALLTDVQLNNIGTEATTTTVAADVYMTTATTIDPGTDLFLGRLVFAPIGAQTSTVMTLTATIPGALAPGYYTVGAVLDADDVVDEAVEANNIVNAETRFLLGSEVSGEVSEVVAGAPGDPTFLTFDLINGGAPEPSVQWALYLSTDLTLDPGDTQIASSSTAIAARPRTTVTASVTLPDLTPDAYYVILEVDPTNAISEADEGNNTSVSAPFLVGPELAIAIANSGATGPGEVYPIEISLLSTGGTVGEVDWQVFLSTDDQWDVSDQEIASGREPMGTTRELVLDVDAQIPNVQPIEYYLIAVIDPLGAIDEVDEANNTALSQPVDLFGADIVSVTLVGEARGFRGDTMNVTVQMDNTGGGNASNFFYEIYLSDNLLITVTDTSLGEFGPLTLVPGESFSMVHAVEIPGDLAAGMYHLGLIADSGSTVGEELEANNILRWQTPVEVRDPAPDFTVADLALVGEAAAGESMPIQRVIENAGNAEGTCRYDIYLSTDRVLDVEADLLIGEAAATLDAVSLNEGVDQVPVPATVSEGEYYVIYDLDAAAEIDELNEANNTVSSTERVYIEGASLAILTQQIAPAVVSLPYEIVFTAVGGAGPLAWSVVDGLLPTGLALDADGRLHGTTLVEGKWTFTAMVSDGVVIAARVFDLVVAAPSLDLEIVTRGVPPAWLGRPYRYPMTAIGGVQPLTWQVTGLLPDGLTLSEAGELSGIPTQAAAGVVTVVAEDLRGARATRQIAVRVVSGNDAVRFQVDPLENAVVDLPYEERLLAVHGDAPYTFELSAGVLPPGLLLEENSLSGVPSTVGVYDFTMRVTDNRGDFDVNRYLVEVTEDDPVRFVTVGLPAADVGEDYVDAVGNAVRVKAISTVSPQEIGYSIAHGRLPEGLRLETDGMLSGVPTEPGVFDFLVVARDSRGSTDVAAFGLAVRHAKVEPMPVTTTDGCGCSGTDSTTGGPLSFLAVLLGLGVVLRRRRWGALAVLCLTVLTAVPEASAQQVVPYFQSTRAEPYVSRTGGSDLGLSSTDDGEARATLPFGFNFYGTEYTDVNVSSNGYITFGAMSARSLSNQGIPNASDPDAFIAPFFDDLYGPTATTYLDGVSPRRVFTIQIENCAHYGDRTASLSWQIRLHEGPSGLFEVHYGPGSGTGFSGTMGFENGDGSEGLTFLGCGAGGNCQASDILGQEGIVHVAIRDGGEDVSVGAITPPMQAYAGVPFALTHDIVSLHRNPLGPFSYSIHMLAPGETEPGPLLLSGAPLTLMPYETRSVTDDVAFPLDAPPGRYRVAVVLDPDESLTEIDETNNVGISLGEILVGERRPDFAIAALDVSVPSAMPGSDVTATVTLQNAGNLAGTASWQLRLSRNRVITIDDTLLAEGTATLEPLTTQVEEVSITVPESLPPGRYYVGGLMDASNQVLELNEVNNSGAQTDALAVGSGFLEVVTSRLLPALEGIQYSMFLRASGGDGMFLWSVAEGELPDGIELNAETGELFGVPTAEGTTNLTFQVDSSGLSASEPVVFEVRSSSPGLVIVTRNLLPGLVGASYPPASDEAPQKIATLGGAGPVTFTLASEAPPGLELDEDGTVHGVPSRTGDYRLSVVATDGTDTSSRTISLLVADPGRLRLASSELPPAMIGEAYQFRLVTVGAAEGAALTYRAVGGSDGLPAGITLTSDGLLDGVPLEVTKASFAVEVSEGDDPAAPRDTARFHLVVEQNTSFKITPDSLPVALLKMPYEVFIDAVGGQPPFSWRIELSEQLPTGMSWDVEDADGIERIRIFGSPETVPNGGGDLDTAGVVTLLVSVRDAVGRTAKVPLSIQVREAEVEVEPIVPEADSCSCSSGVPAGSPYSPALLLLLLPWVRRRRRL